MPDAPKTVFGTKSVLDHTAVPLTDEAPFIWFVTAKTRHAFEQQLPRLRHSLRGVFRYVSSPNVLSLIGYDEGKVGFVEIDDASIADSINFAWCQAVARIEESKHPLVYIELNTEPRS